MSNGRRRPTGRKRRNTYTTKSGRTIKVNRNLSERVQNWRDSIVSHKAVRLAGMPKSRLGRLLFRLKPKNLYKYWFSREGLIMALKVMGLGIVAGFILLVGAFAYFRKDLPAINNIYGQNLGGSISYYDRTGKTLLFEDYNAVKRLPVSNSQISPNLKNATVAIEDKNFYHEGAFDIGAIMRSAYHDIFHSGGGLEGGSTITQQLVKLNENWTYNRTIFRKIKEVILASELEREYSKDDILTGYLNIAPYGSVDYGAQAAAQDYFHENASQLDIAQSAFLAAIPQAPYYYSPYSPGFDKGALLGRQEYIIHLMQQQGYITSAQEQSALQENVLSEIQPQTSKYSGILAPYFVMAAKQQLEQQFGQSNVQRGGWKVITTLDWAQQQYNEKVVADNLNNVIRDGGDEEATVVENVPTGQVTSLVGGVNFFDPDHGQINYATSLIEPGSSYKLYDYTALINDNNNVGAGSVLYDSQGPLPGYPCTDKARPFINNVPTGGNCLWDYDFKYPGPETLRYALGGSRNVPAVKAMLINGESKTIALSEAMGLKSGYNCYSDVYLTQTTQCYASAAIGDGAYLHLNEHVNGFATDSRLGKYIPQTFILKITDSTGKTIYNWTQPQGTQVVKPDAAYIVDNMLSDPRASYLPGSCSAYTCSPLSSFGYKFQRDQGWDVAIKTGTTNDDYDGLMMAMTTQYAVGTWVGYHTRDKAMIPHIGGFEGLTEPLARSLIEYTIQGQKPINWTQPSDIKVLPAYVQTTHIDYGDEEPGPSKDLYPSWYNPPQLGNHSYTIDKVSNMLATSCTPALAKETVGASYNANVFSIDTFVNGGAQTNSQYNLTQYDDVHQCDDTMPSISISDNGGTNTSPGITCNNGSCSVDISVTQGTHPLSSSQFPLQINAIIDGGSPIAANCTFTPTMDPTNPPSQAQGTCTFNYNTPGTHTLVMQVIDSVLYSSNSNQTAYISVTGGTPPGQGGATQGNQLGGNGNGQQGGH